MMTLLVALLTFVLFMAILTAFAVLMGAAFTQLPQMLRRAFALPEPCLDGATADALTCKEDLARGQRDTARIVQSKKVAADDTRGDDTGADDGGD